MGIPVCIIDVIGFMGSIVSQIEEERIILITANKLNSIVSREIGIMDSVCPTRILYYIDQFLAMKTIIGVIIGIIRMGSADEPSIKLIKTAIEWRGLMIKAIEMPLDRKSVV